jgi:putative ABC transport system permease protein
VLGASVSSIVLLLSKEFSKWVLIANIIAWPVAWYAINKWLEHFAYHTDIKWHLFLISGVLTLFIALATVSFQAVKAALSNPVDTIRYE